MLKPMFGHRPKPKKFEYQFRYYDPEKDEKERRRRRIKIERKHTKYHQGRSVLLYAVGLGIVVWIMTLL